MKTLDIQKLLGNDLIDVELPGRYVGGEFGVYKPSDDTMLNVGVCFPDLYEIGMSNQAVKILYDAVNSLDRCTAQRVFVPAPDFSKVLKEKNIPLYTLEQYHPLYELDVLAVSVGYELLATNVLSVLDHGMIPLRSRDRKEEHPIVIAGGPGITNPAPFIPFLDACYIGEAEGAFPEILAQLAEMKQQGASRSEMIEKLSSFSCIYTVGKESAVRCIDSEFSSRSTVPRYFCVPSIKTVQDHGPAEIMRGCPNGCRFCHAGMLYRPFRQISAEEIFTKSEQFIFTQGYDNITLSSLSTGDYPQLAEVVRGLDEAFGDGHVSFGLPSLKIDSFTLDLLEEVSKVRKSGLTFAVETPNEFGQAVLNKRAERSKVLDILLQAKKRGWKLAKFYFMIGLPGTDLSSTAEEIITYISEMEKQAKINLNVNIGTYIPKPHTPFQWVKQISEEEALSTFRIIKDAFRKNRFVKVSYHDTFISMLEGVISRGGERVGDLIETAYRNGAVLDAWDEHLNRDIWREAVTDVFGDVSDLLRERDAEEQLPWDCIDVGVTKKFLHREYRKALEGKLTDVCAHACDHACGACRSGLKPVIGSTTASAVAEAVKRHRQKYSHYYQSGEQKITTVLVKFTKLGKSVYISHINMMKVFERALRRSGIPVRYSQGYNPKPKIDFAHPLSLGTASEAEYLVFQTSMDEEELNSRIRDLSEALPEGIDCLGVYGVKTAGKFSLMAQYGGAEYELQTDDPEEIRSLAEQHSHLSIIDQSESSVRIRIIVSEGLPDIYKIAGDKYGFMKKYHPKRTETLSKEQTPIDQASFLA